MSNKLDQLKTERLLLRKLSPSDAALIQRLNSDEEVMQYIGPTEDSFEKAQAYVNLRVAQYEDRPGLGIFVAELSGEDGEISEQEKKSIGWFCLKNLDDSDLIEVGYRLLPDYWNKGFATEGAQALVDHGFAQLGLPEVVGVTLPTNLASQAVLRKVGLTYEGLGNYYGHELSFFRRRAKVNQEV